MSKLWPLGLSYLEAKIDLLGVSLRWRFGPGCCEPSPLCGLGHAAAILDAAALAATNLLSAQSSRTGYSDLDLNCPHEATPHKARPNADVPDSAFGRQGTVQPRTQFKPSSGPLGLWSLGLSGLAGA